MPDELDLSVPPRRAEPKRAFRWTPVLLVILLWVGLVNVYLATRRGGTATPRPAARPAALPPEAQKSLALKLEREDLHDAAVRAWQAYLAGAALDDEQRASIWYRIGTVHQRARRFEQAIEAYSTSESIAVVAEVAPEIARRASECLEALGKFAALGQQLTDRVDLGAAQGSGDEVVAEIGAQKITKAQLDQAIEDQIEHQLQRVAGLLPPERLKEQKKALLERFSTAPARLDMLKQLVARELLYRQARDEKLADQPRTRAMLASIQKELLAQRALETVLAQHVKISPDYVKTYYEAHQKDYRQPERAQVSRILVKDEKAAQDVLKRLKAGETFEDLAKELSLDPGTKDKGGELTDWIEKGRPLGDSEASDELLAVIFSTDHGKVAQKPVKARRGVHVLKIRKREPERQKTLEEVRDEVFRTLRAQESRKVRSGLLNELHQRYNAVIHHAKFEPRTPEAKPGSAAPPKTPGTKAHAPKPK